jgi:hypothetical protein
MNAIEFIEKNIVAELTKQGYHETVALQSSNQAIDHYRRCSSSTGKGKMFDDCLHIAKAWASKLQKNKTK